MCPPSRVPLPDDRVRPEVEVEDNPELYAWLRAATCLTLRPGVPAVYVQTVTGRMFCERCSRRHPGCHAHTSWHTMVHGQIEHACRDCYRPLLRAGDAHRCTRCTALFIRMISA